MRGRLIMDFPTESCSGDGVIVDFSQKFCLSVHCFFLLKYAGVVQRLLVFLLLRLCLCELLLIYTELSVGLSVH